MNGDKDTVNSPVVDQANQKKKSRKLLLFIIIAAVILAVGTYIALYATGYLIGKSDGNRALEFIKPQFYSSSII
jgi:flagellar basal body-associated protein FliL